MSELLRVLLVLFLTVLLVALLWQLPWFLLFVLLVPLALSLWFWPYASTILSYLVAAIFGTLLTGWSMLGAVEGPAQSILRYLWIPLVWGPAGVVIKRLELLLVKSWRRLPKID